MVDGLLGTNGIAVSNEPVEPIAWRQGRMYLTRCVSLSHNRRSKYYWLAKSHVEMAASSDPEAKEGKVGSF